MGRRLRPGLARPTSVLPGAGGVATPVPAVCAASSSRVVTLTSAGAAPIGGAGALAGPARASRARRTACLAAFAEAIGDPAADSGGAAATLLAPSVALPWLVAAPPGPESVSADPAPADLWASSASESESGAGQEPASGPASAPESGSGSAAASAACPAFSRASSSPSAPGRRVPIRRSLSAVACRRRVIAQTPTNNWPGKDRQARSHQERRWHRSAR